MNSFDFLNQLYIRIKQCKKNYDILIPFVYANKDVLVSEAEFYAFTKLFGKIAVENDNCVLGITGSGGSKIPKPNIGTIAALYLSQVPNINVIKVGSCRYSGKMGSTDLLTELGYHKVRDKDCFFRNNGFFYADVSEFAEWKLCAGILKLNSSIEKIMHNMVIDEFQCTIKFTGTVFPEHTAELQTRTLYIDQPWYVYGGYIGDRIIDEFVPGNNFILNNGKKANIKFPMSETPFQQIDNVLSINKDLINGSCSDKFWLASLRYTIASMLFLSGNAESFLHGVEKFEKLYRDRVAQKLVDRMGKHL